MVEKPSMSDRYYKWKGSWKVGSGGREGGIHRMHIHGHTYIQRGYRQPPSMKRQYAT